MAITRPTGERLCPRCSYQGQGMPYFRKGSHVGLLIGASVFYMLPGIIYWLARRKHLICPRCGLDWEYSSRALTAAGPDLERKLIEEEPGEPLPSAGLKRRVLGAATVLFATLLVTMGFIDFAPEAIGVGSVFGAGGSSLFYWGWSSLQNRRKALMQGLQRKILKLASMKGGQLTVTEVAADLNLALPAAERVMEEMDDGFRVRSDISPEGVIVYEFPELQHQARKALDPGD